MSITASSGTWTIGDNWPWPRMFIISHYVLAVVIEESNLTLFELVNDSNQWTATKMQVLGTLSSIESVSIADFDQYYVITVFGYSGSILTTMMYARNPNAASGTSAMSTISSGTIPHGTAICSHLGQMIIGGLKSTDAKWSELGTCAVAYGGIMNMEFNPYIDPSAGFLKMPWDIENQGKIYSLLSLHNDVIVYGDRGIERLTPFNSNEITGYGQRTIWPYGILGFNCAAGTDDIHCFIDSNYDLCLLPKESDIKVLGYRPFMKTLVRDKIILSYEPKRRHFYISDGLLCYILTESGMYTTHQCVSGVGTYGSISCGFIKDNTDTKIRFVTTEFDLTYQNNKAIEEVEFGVNYNTEADHLLTGCIYTKYDYSSDFTKLPWIGLNNKGILNQKCAGRTFKIGLESNYESGAEFSFDSLYARVSFDDKHNVTWRLKDK